VQESHDGAGNPNFSKALTGKNQMRKRFSIVVGHMNVTLAIGMGIFLFACTNQHQLAYAEGLSFLTSQRTCFVNERGEEVILKGCNLGSWLNLEMWMMDIKDDEQYPDQYTIENVLQDRFGQAEKDRIMDLHRENWITVRDFEIISALGFNCIRVPFHYNTIEDEQKPMHLRDDAWRWLDRAIDLADKHQLYVILDLHAAAGSQNLFDHSGRKDWNKMWGDRVYWKRTAWLWRQIARRYKDCPTVACYQPINEPWGGTPAQQRELFETLYQAIRQSDDRHVIIASADVAGFDHFGDPQESGWSHVGFSQNFYPGLFGGGAILPETHKGFLQWLDDELAPKLRGLNVPFLVTEFNVVFDAAGGGEMMRRHYDAYARHNWAATMWSYKLITSPGRKNTGGWWLITNTGQRKTGAWWIVTNQIPLPAPDFKTAEKDQIEAWFRSFSSVPYEINEPLRKALQAMDSPGPIETIAKETMTVPPATDALAGWTAIDINDPLPGGQKRISDSAIDLYAAGSDVYGTADQFRFVCQKLSGDFTISATLDYLTFTHVYAKAGLMIRQDLEKDSAFASVQMLPDGSVEFGTRATKGRDVRALTVMGPEPPIQVKLVRKGNVIERQFAIGGGDWDKLDAVEFESLETQLYAGVFCTSHDNETLATAKFRNITVAEK
jgi:glucan 1,3-beta-glucosidase